MSVPTWADEFRKIPAQEGGGKWRTSTVEVARGPMLAVTEPGVHTITAMTATQILKSSLLLSVVGYFAHLDPAPMMLVQPKDDAADAFSKERITPFITATPVLRNLIGIRGDNEQTGVRSPVWPPMAKARRSRATGFRPITIGTNAAKDTLSARLQIAAPGPGYMHWPAFWDRSRFEQLTAEKLDTRKTKNGRPYRVWVPKQGRSNEALDCRVYGYAALCGLLHRGLKLNKRATEVGARSDGTIVLAGTDEAERLEAERKAAPPAEAPPAEPKKKKKPPRVGRSSYMQRIGR